MGKPCSPWVSSPGFWAASCLHSKQIFSHLPTCRLALWFSDCLHINLCSPVDLRTDSWTHALAHTALHTGSPNLFFAPASITFDLFHLLSINSNCTQIILMFKTQNKTLLMWTASEDTGKFSPLGVGRYGLNLHHCH